MKHALAFALVLTLVGCAKDKSPASVAYTASCRMCAIEWEQDGFIRRDTVVGKLNYSAGELIDTTKGTGRWNVVLDEGEHIYFRACHLRPDSVDGEITITTDVGDRCDSWGGECSTIDRAFHQ